MFRRIAAGTVAAASLSLSLTGCLGGAEKKAVDNIKLTAAQVLGKSAQKSATVDTFTMDLTMDGPTKMNMKVESRLRPSLAARMIVSNGGAQVMEMRIVDKAMYMKSAFMKPKNGKAWGRISADAMSAASGRNMNQMFDQAQQQGPAEQTKMFTASKNVREVGPETVEGVPTRHFTGTLTAEEMLSKFTDPQARAAKEKQLAAAGITSANFDLWVGADELPRKITLVQGTKQGQMTMSGFYRDYNKPVDVQAPPASEVGDVELPRIPTGA
ncbi:LolA-like protein [Actinomadura macrotermitis]|uniref:Lipoprotein n=1 Tax=Actinomadura macrotermitis TaxID=2585200 RepID=A0A7K0BYB8_9ACTN|nr:hypothetical protein [Actinomadura macrotermitis]MQY06169.1 hypothetical protein [Actinomadura macrotermitis]